MLTYCCFRRRIAGNTFESTRPSRVELPSTTTPNLSHYIIGPGGKRFVEMGEKTISEIIYPNQDVMSPTSPISQHASLQLLPGGAYLYDPQNGINGALVQLYQRPYQISPSSPQQEPSIVPIQTATMHAQYSSRASSPHPSPTARYYARFSTDHISPIDPGLSNSAEPLIPTGRSTWYDDEVSPASTAPSFYSYLHPSSAGHRTPSRQPSVETQIPMSPMYLYPPSSHSMRSVHSMDRRLSIRPPSEEMPPGSAM
jgi:hypothetical protein